MQTWSYFSILTESPVTSDVQKWPPKFKHFGVVTVAVEITVQRRELQSRFSHSHVVCLQGNFTSNCGGQQRLSSFKYVQFKIIE